MFNFIFSILTPEPLKHFGICDASAAVPLGQEQFIVGNDEADEELGNLLRVYSSQESGKVTTLPISINEFVNTQYLSQNKSLQKFGQNWYKSLYIGVWLEK
jgi:hypothetical protein